MSAPIPNVCHQILITSLCHHKDCMMMCMQHVETLLASHFLHNRHQKASASPSGCLPSLKMPIKSAIWIFPPVLECIVAPLIVCAYSKMSHCHFGVTQILTCGSLVAILSNSKYPHLSSSVRHPTFLLVLVSLADASSESSKQHTSVFLQVS